MKTSVYAVLMAFVLAIGFGGFSAEVEAKKFGGGKSFGKSYSVPKSTSANKAATTTSSAAKKKSGLFGGGLMGGLMGGLLAGGIFAALMGSGAFDGFAFGDILLFALVGFLIYKFFIAPKRQQAAAAAANNAQFRQMPGADSFQQAPTASANPFKAQDPAMQLPPDFNEAAFVAEAKNHYSALQKAWDENDFAEISDYVTPELLAMLQAERANYGADKPKTEIISLDVELVRGEYQGSISSITLKFSGWIKEGEDTSDSTEYWHLEKNMSQQSSNWTIVGIQQDN